MCVIRVKIVIVFLHIFLWLNCCSPIRTWWLAWSLSLWSWKGRKMSSSYVIRLLHVAFWHTLWIKIEVVIWYYINYVNDHYLANTNN